MPWNQKCEARELGECYGRLDPDHIFTHGAGACDHRKNLGWICRKHHDFRNLKGVKSFYSLSSRLWSVYLEAVVHHDTCPERSVGKL